MTPRAIREDSFSRGHRVRLRLDITEAVQFLLAASPIRCCVSISGLQDWQTRTNRSWSFSSPLVTSLIPKQIFFLQRVATVNVLQQSIYENCIRSPEWLYSSDPYKQGEISTTWRALHVTLKWARVLALSRVYVI